MLLGVAWRPVLFLFEGSIFFGTVIWLVRVGGGGRDYLD